jgi:phage baseplate assembly protein W
MKETFTSIRYPAAIDAALGKMAEQGNYPKHVEELMMQVLLTSPGERINRPDFGCGVKRMIFAPNSKVSAALAQVTIFEGLTRWLGSVVTVDNVKVEPREETLDILIAYVLKARQERRYLNLEVTP